jgi:tRNA 2-thiouridine synthesizing protein A
LILPLVYSFVMDRITDTTEDSDAAALLKNLLQTRGSRCKECAALLCGHDALMSLVAGCQDSPRCLSCLARLMGEDRERVRDHLLGYIMTRGCRRAGWMWANQEEQTEADALPKCLWPAATTNGEKQRSEVQEMSTKSQPGAEPRADAEWDAGAMGCGELVMMLRTRLLGLKPGQVLKLRATDEGAPEDLPAWCRLTGNKLIVSKHPEYWIQRKEN